MASNWIPYERDIRGEGSVLSLSNSAIIRVCKLRRRLLILSWWGTTESPSNRIRFQASNLENDSSPNDSNPRIAAVLTHVTS